MKKRLLLHLVACLFCSAASAATQVKGYYRKDGTYVAPHQRSSPNATTSDNYSSKGNVNTNTGKTGRKSEEVATGKTNATSAVAAGQSAQTPAGQTRSSSAPASQPAQSSERPPAPPLADLSKIKIGMTKAQVVIAVGEPNVKAEASWFYTERGWVRFKADSVRQVEAR